MDSVGKCTVGPCVTINYLISLKELLFIPEKISEHNYRAVGSTKPEKSARVQAKRLRNKCEEVMKCINYSPHKYSYVNWTEHIDSNPEYYKALDYVKDLYQNNHNFRSEIQQTTEAALVCMKTSRESFAVDGQSPTNVDVEEGAKYLLKELAFFDALPHIYDNCTEYVFVYHRSWPVLEKYCEGLYDGLVRPSLGFVVF